MSLQKCSKFMARVLQERGLGRDESAFLDTPRPRVPFQERPLRGPGAAAPLGTLVAR